jgi:hypothetical protein
MWHSRILIYITLVLRRDAYKFETENVIFYANITENPFPCQTAMLVVYYVGNVSTRYVIVPTFQLHSKNMHI